ncbi:MAG: AzlD domain-containing protein [Ilumatobacteraceae bacterium]
MSGFHDVAYMAAAAAGLTVVTFATRSSFFMLPPRIQLPKSWERALRYAPVCALSAIIAPTVFTRNHEPYISWHNHQMWALLAAAAVFARWRNMTAMIVVGMAVFTVVRLSGV